jgi:hypothetical protein
MKLGSAMTSMARAAKASDRGHETERCEIAGQGAHPAEHCEREQSNQQVDFSQHYAASRVAAAGAHRKMPLDDETGPGGAASSDF